MTRKHSIATLALVIVLSLTGSIFGRAEMDDSGRYGGRQATAEVAYCVASHSVGELVLAVNNNGTFGTGFSLGSGGDCFTGGQVKSCEYPKGANTSYLFAGAFWIGAVVGRDTLVSVGADGWSSTREMTPFRFPMTRRSIINPDVPEFEGAISEEDFLCYYTDTVTEGLQADPFDGPHRPIGIGITERSFAWSYTYAEDLILFDYQIKNLGTRPLENVYMGLYNDGDVCFDCGNGGYSDDITGFVETNLRRYGDCLYLDTVNIAWLADNEGNLLDLHPVPHVTAMRVVRTPAEVLDVSYNWWISAGSAATDFGPRERGGVGRLKEDFRDFGTGGLGTPETDRNKYYIMQNKEFDYDQAKVASIPSNDTLWLYPNQDNVESWARGLDTRYLLSFGPFEILPGQSLPVSFAYLGGLGLHTKLGNLDNLPDNFDLFYDNLDFSDLAENSTWASWIYDNPGVDSDSDGYAGKFRVCVTESALIDTLVPDSGWMPIIADTIWYEGDGIPDFRGASPPPAPKFWLTPSVGAIHVRFNGSRTETTLDLFTHLADFEGYRIYLGRDNRSTSYSLISSYDVENYNRYIFNDTRNLWELKDPPFSLDSLRCLYADSCNDPTFDPRDYSRTNPLEHSSYPGQQFYFEPQDFNASDIGGAGYISKVYPNQPPPSHPLPDSADPEELTAEGMFKYYEYMYTIENLLPTIPYWVNVTAFDYGSPQSDLPSLETSVTVGAKDVYPSSSYDDVLRDNPDIIVYPNPYRADATYRSRGYEGRSEQDRPDDRVRRIHFTNLPARCTIKIYTIDGDLVRQIDHDKSPTDPNAAHEYWNMITRNTQMVVSGLYYWVVEAEGFETQIGKLVVIM